MNALPRRWNYWNFLIVLIVIAAVFLGISLWFEQAAIARENEMIRTLLADYRARGIHTLPEAYHKALADAAKYDGEGRSLAKQNQLGLETASTLEAAHQKLARLQKWEKRLYVPSRIFLAIVIVLWIGALFWTPLYWLLRLRIDRVELKGMLKASAAVAVASLLLMPLSSKTSYQKRSTAMPDFTEYEIGLGVYGMLIELSNEFFEMHRYLQDMDADFRRQANYEYEINKLGVIRATSARHLAAVQDMKRRKEIKGGIETRIVDPFAAIARSLERGTTALLDHLRQSGDWDRGLEKAMPEFESALAQLERYTSVTLSAAGPFDPRIAERFHPEAVTAYRSASVEDPADPFLSFGVQVYEGVSENITAPLPQK